MMKNEQDIALAIIKRCGGAKVVADWCEVTPKSVYKWRENGIPNWHHQIILMRAIDAGIDLMPLDFFYARSVNNG